VKLSYYPCIAELNRDIEKLQSIRDQLQQLADCCHGDQRPDCPIIEELAAGLWISIVQSS
jgi:hypothetical protein